MNQATNPVEESPELKSSVDKVTDLLTRPSDNSEESNQVESKEQEYEDVPIGEELTEDSDIDNFESEEYDEEILEDESDSELYADEQIEDNSEDDLQEELIEVKIDGKLEQVSLDELRNGYSRQQHFTRQSQKLAEEKKQFEIDSAKVLEERQQYAQLLGTLEQQIQQMDSDPEPDWNALYEIDPVEASKKQHEYNSYKQSKAQKLQAIESEKQRIANETRQAELVQYQKILTTEAEKLPEVIPSWKDEKVATKEKAELKNFLMSRGVTEEEVSALVKANHVSVLRDAMLYNKGKRKVVKRRTASKGTKVLKSGSKKAPKKTDAYKKTTSRLKKNGNWRDAHQAVSMLLNE